MLKSDSIKNISAALLNAQKEMGNALKDSANPFFKSKFADLNSVREAVTPSLHKNGISILQPTMILDLVHGTKSVVRTTLLHESGEYISSDTEIVSKDALNPQALGSAISYARRYGLSSMLSVGTEDDDGEDAMIRLPAKSSNLKGEATPSLEKSNGSFGSFRKN